MNLPLQFYQTVNFINALLSLSIGTLILLIRRKTKEMVLFVFFVYFVFLWDIFYFFAFQTTDYQLSRFLFRTCMIAGTLILPIFTEFVFALVKREMKMVYRIINFGLSTLIIATIYTDLYAYDGGPFMGFHYWPIIGVMAAVQIFLYAVNVFFSHRELIHASFSVDARLKNQARIVVVGTSLGYLGAATNFLLWFRIPFPPVLNVLIPIYVISVAYAITKHRLMNISVIISKTVAWGITVLFFGVIYGSLLALYRNFISTEIGLLFFAISLIYGILVGYWFQKIRLFLQTTAEKAFVKGWYDFPVVVRKIAAAIGKSLTRADIAKSILPILRDDLDIAQSQIYFLDKTKGNYVEWDVGAGEEKENSNLTAEDPLVKQSLDKKDIVSVGGKLCVPSFSDDKLAALIVLGKKRSEDEYAAVDIELFRTISEYMTITLEYVVKPFEEVREKFEAAQYKLREAERQLERSQRLASLGTLTAGVTHEIRNPMTVIRGKVETLFKKERDEAYLKDAQRVIIQNVDRVEAIIEGMLNLAKDGKHQLNAKADLGAVAKTALCFISFANVNVVEKLDKVSPITGNVEELQQVFINLIQNALQATASGGTITVQTAMEENQVVARISDTGKGIPKEIREKIFDPFFSSRHEGVGIGLSIVYRIVREHGGTIEVESKVGQGTTFVLRFPAAA